MYEEELRAEVSQGDIFKDVPIAYVVSSPNSSEISATVLYVNAVMISYDCDYDKKNCDYAIFVEIRPLSEVDRGSHGNILKYKTRHTFYLPAIPGVIEESYIDLRRIDRVYKKVVAFKAETGDRLASLTQEAREALQLQIAVFFGLDRDLDSDSDPSSD